MLIFAGIISTVTESLALFVDIMFPNPDPHPIVPHDPAVFPTGSLIIIEDVNVSSSSHTREKFFVVTKEPFGLKVNPEMNQKIYI